MSATAQTRAREIITALRSAEDHHRINASLTELGTLIATDEAAFAEVLRYKDDLLTALDAAKVGAAGVVARMAALGLALATPVNAAGEHHPEFSRGGPASEVALAAFHILRYAGEVVPLDPDLIASALESPDVDPDFGDYPAVFSATVAHLQEAAYYLLDPNDSYAALASEPPEQETFPPLPFPRIWLEMTHLSPFMRFKDGEDRLSEQWRTLDVLGLAIAEIEQGQVWDVYVPFQFVDDNEFFVLAQRIGPERVLASDPLVALATDFAFREIRKLAVGGVHLITARNVPSESVVLPRHQRKRLATTFVDGKPKVYFVNLAASGEHVAAAGSATREYHVRWLVRGHWRHSLHGRRFCTCCDPPQIASWVDPYVKGPVGAPWKGRQVRRLPEATA